MSENTEVRVQRLIDATQRMRKDAERVQLRVESLRNSNSKDSLKDIEDRLWEVDDVNAEIGAIVAFLSTIQMMVFSSEYPQELFQLALIHKNEFLRQVTNLLSYYKTIAFSIQEMSKTARVVYEYHSQLDILKHNIDMKR